jgi:electron transfer flavoprotein alpha subunit
VDSSQKHKRVLILAEIEDGQVASMTFELLQAGRELANKVGGNLCTAVLGHEISKISGEIARFSDEVYSLDHPLLTAFQLDLYTQALENLYGSAKPDIFLLGHTSDNLDFAPRLACKMGTELITDCTFLDIEPKTEHLLCTKPVYGGRALAIFEMIKKPQMATLRPRSTESITEPILTKGEIIQFDPAIEKSLIRTESMGTVLGESVRLEKADVIVDGGRGVKSIEGINLLKELIEVLKKNFDRVELGGTRTLVESSFLPRSRQLGQTGEKASPQLCLAIGVSGSGQHLCGISGAKTIVAINKDEQAPIFASADYGVVGTYEDVVPALIKRLKELL